MPQFTEEEAQRIFARAAERQHEATDAAPGLSLEELREIGQAAGLSAEHIAAAVAEMRANTPSVETGRTVMGIQTDVQRSRVIPGDLTDEMWEGLVSRSAGRLRQKASLRTWGRTREWTGTNSTGGLSNLHVLAEPVEEGTRITLETSRTDEARQLKWLPVAFVFLTAFMPLIGAAKGKFDEPVLWVFSAFVAAIGALGFFSAHRGYKTWSERRQGEFDALLDQAELMARTEMAPVPEVASSMPATQDPILGDALNELAG